MKHPERVEDYLEHIAKAIARATGYVEAFRQRGRSLGSSQLPIRMPSYVTLNSIRRGCRSPNSESDHPQLAQRKFWQLPWLDMRGHAQQDDPQLL